MRSGADGIPADLLERAFMASCRAELEAMKPGNVHVHAAGHGMTVDDFLRSATAAAPPLCRSGTPVGARIRRAIEASRAVVAQNINLGIVLLAAPVLAAAAGGSGDLEARLRQVLERLTVEDAREAFAAILLAQPGGLGRVAEQDVAEPPTVTLLDAMRLAAERDLVARQYATGYRDVFAIGVARLEQETQRGTEADWMTTLVYLDFLAGFPDSHIARKAGVETAETVRREAMLIRQSLPDDRGSAFAALEAFDRDLKARGLNPGTSADLTVASLLAFELDRALGSHPSHAAPERHKS